MAWDGKARRAASTFCISSHLHPFQIKPNQTKHGLGHGHLASIIFNHSFLSSESILCCFGLHRIASNHFPVQNLFQISRTCTSIESISQLFPAVLRRTPYPLLLVLCRVARPVVTLGCPPAQHFNPPNLRHPHFVFVDRCNAFDRHTARF